MQYFQKSKIFLYPLLGIRKGEDFVPTETYICWADLYDKESYKYICIYNTNKTLKFKLFEDKFLNNHSMLHSTISFSEDKHAYIFDYSKYKHDFDMFVDGKYSKLSVGTKSKILNYFGKVGKISNYIKSYLNPEEYHDVLNTANHFTSDKVNWIRKRVLDLGNESIRNLTEEADNYTVSFVFTKD